MSVARQDPTVTRRYFYSIKDINIGGRCVCNGHAETCDLTDPREPFKLLCRCKHNTCGSKCEECCPGYKQKKWRRAIIDAPFVCERKLFFLITLILYVASKYPDYKSTIKVVLQMILEN